MEPQLTQAAFEELPEGIGPHAHHRGGGGAVEPEHVARDHGLALPQRQRRQCSLQHDPSVAPSSSPTDESWAPGLPTDPCSSAGRRRSRPRRRRIIRNAVT